MYSCACCFCFLIPAQRSDEGVTRLLRRADNAFAFVLRTGYNFVVVIIYYFVHPISECLNIVYNLIFLFFFLFTNISSKYTRKLLCPNLLYSKFAPATYLLRTRFVPCSYFLRFFLGAIEAKEEGRKCGHGGAE